MRELKQTCYRPVTAVLGSREQLCVKNGFGGLNVTKQEIPIILNEKEIAS